MEISVVVEPDPVIARDPIGSVVEAAIGPDGLGTATFDDDRSYRYRLSRVWDDKLPRIAWCMLNPSTASAFRLDPTIRRIIGFSRSWGYGAAEVVNLFAWRTAHPKELASETADPVGPLNDVAIVEAGTAVGGIIAAWGNNGLMQDRQTGVRRAEEVRALLVKTNASLHYLRLTKRSQPGHPLYIPSDTSPALWS